MAPRQQTSPRPKGSERVASDRIVEHVRRLVSLGELKPGDRLPPERELAESVGVSRASLRSGLKKLMTMGLLRSRQGSGTWVTGGPPSLMSEPLELMAELHGLTQDHLFEARDLLEVGVAGLAAERALPEHLATLADEVAGLFASTSDPLAYLEHDVRFHRAVAAATHNPALGALVEMVSRLFYDSRKRTIRGAHDLQESALLHLSVYRAIRARDAALARKAMAEHMLHAQRLQRRDAAAKQSQVPGRPAKGKRAP
jgi:GntR family transcriptional repressor for pyruvate dehydrogenase complex